MMIEHQKVLPAVRDLKEFERLMNSPFQWLILLHSHVAQVTDLAKIAKRSGKQLILHADLIRGMKADEAAAQFICQVVRPAGVISTHGSILSVARKRGLVTIQRVFLLDSSSLETSYRVLESCHPDYLELLPGRMPSIIQEVKARTQKPIIAGGFIRTKQDIQEALAAGATAVSTSDATLWDAKLTPITGSGNGFCFQRQEGI